MASNYRDMYKRIELDYMLLLDDYNELARALGFKGVGLWGDVTVEHDVLVDKAKRLQEDLDNMRRLCFNRGALIDEMKSYDSSIYHLAVESVQLDESE